MIIYLDASAAAKLLVDEQWSAALVAYLDQHLAAGSSPVSSMLLETELRRMATRLDVDQTAVTRVLDRLDLAEPDHAIFVQAGLLPGANLRSLDALHIAHAMRLVADEFVTYDDRQRAAAEAAGLPVVAPA